MPNFIKSIVVSTFVVLLQNIQPAIASEPISIRGVHWAMSTTEQIASLETDGLTCLQRDEWSTLSPNSKGSAKAVHHFCIETDRPTETTRNLDQLFSYWETLCQQDRSDCWSWNGFRDQFEETHRVTVVADEEIIFDCSYLKTCAFSPNDIVSALQQRGHSGPWKEPVEDSYVLCTIGPIREALCVHWHSKAVWLMKSSVTSKMKF